MINRRSFLQLSILTASIPAILAVEAVYVAEPALSASPSRPTREPDDAHAVVFDIEGWDVVDSANPDETSLSIRLNQSWRTAWR